MKKSVLKRERERDSLSCTSVKYTNDRVIRDRVGPYNSHYLEIFWRQWVLVWRMMKKKMLCWRENTCVLFQKKITLLTLLREMIPRNKVRTRIVFSKGMFHIQSWRVHFNLITCFLKKEGICINQSINYAYIYISEVC